MRKVLRKNSPVERAALRELGKLLALKQQIDDRVRHLQGFLAGSQAAQIAQESQTKLFRGDAETNREKIIGILLANRAPMAIKEIASRAFQKKLITSTKGPSGVYNIIATILVRNQKGDFVKVGPGIYDLRNRPFNGGGRSVDLTHLDKSNA